LNPLSGPFLITGKNSTPTLGPRSFLYALEQQLNLFFHQGVEQV